MPEVLSTARGRLTETLKFQENFTSASNLCVLNKGAFVLMFQARDRLQTLSIKGKITER